MRRIRRAHGFTLIEVIIASGLLIALCAGATMVLMLTLQTIDRSRHRATALLLARTKLEQILCRSEAIGSIDYLDAQGQPIAPASAYYERRWTIARTGDGASELLVVQVTVGIKPRGGGDAVWISGARLRRA